MNYNIITQVYNFYWKFLRFHKYFNNFLRCWSIFMFLGSFWRQILPLYIYQNKPVLTCLNWFIWTGLFLVFNSQKSKDWTGKKTRLWSSPVQSSCGLFVVLELDFQTLVELVDLLVSTHLFVLLVADVLNFLSWIRLSWAVQIWVVCFIVMAYLGHSHVWVIESAYSLILPKVLIYFWSVNQVLPVQPSMNVLLEQHKCEVVPSFGLIYQYINFGKHSNFLVSGSGQVGWSTHSSIWPTRN